MPPRPSGVGRERACPRGNGGGHRQSVPGEQGGGAAEGEQIPGRAGRPERGGRTALQSRAEALYGSASVPGTQDLPVALYRRSVDSLARAAWNGETTALGKLCASQQLEIPLPAASPEGGIGSGFSPRPYRSGPCLGGPSFRSGGSKPSSAEPSGASGGGATSCLTSSKRKGPPAFSSRCRAWSTASS